MQLYTYKAHILRVVDADTLELRVDLGFHLAATIRARLHGIDAPEVRGPQRDDGHRAAAWVRQWVSTLRDRQCLIRTHKADSFGRWLVEVFADELSDISLGRLLLEAGHARPWGRRAPTDPLPAA